jgi:serralysin
VYRVGSSPGNNPPAITSNGGGNTAAVSVAENTTAVTTVTATDPDAGQTLSYSINGGADASKFAINVTTGALAFLTAPNFEAPTDAGGNNVYDVTVQVSDGNGGSDTQAIAVSVTDQNESGTGNLVAAINIGGGAYTAVASGINYVADPGPGSGTITYSNRSGDPIGGTQDDVLYQTYGYGDFSYAFAVPGAGAYLVQIELIEPWWNAPGSRLFDVALEGSVPTGFNDIDVYALAGGQFQALTLTETVTVSDGTLDVDLNTLVDNSLLSAIAVYRVGSSPGNNPPAITSNGGSNTAAVSIAENTTAVTTVTATDPDAGQTLSYSIVGGADASKFAINVTTGALAFLTAPNFEAPTDVGVNNVYDVTVQASDGNGGSDTQAIAVSVTDQNEVPNQLPTITSNGGGNTAAVSMAENTTAVTTVTATDPDLGQTLGYSIFGGADASKFTINSTTGALAFVTAPNFEAPTDAGVNNVYDVTVQVSDGNGGIDTQAIAVAVQDVAGVTINGTNQAQTLTGTGENDIINGRGGNDTLQGLGGNDTLNGGAGTDTATYAASVAGVSVSLATGLGSGGDAQGDTLINFENLTGSDLNDILEGNSGSNVLNGGGGADTLTGGAGIDKFLFTATADSSPSAPDLITDFVHGVDIIDFSAIDANTSSNAGGDQAFSFAGQNSNVVANSVSWYESSGNTIIQADVDANTTAEFTIVLTGVNHNLAASDFIL